MSDSKDTKNENEDILNDFKKSYMTIQGYAKLHKIPIDKLRKIILSEENEQINRQPIYIFPRKRITVPFPHQQIQIDLMDISNEAEDNDNYNFIFVAVDAFSRFAYAYPQHNKNANDTLTSFKKLVKDANPTTIQADKGSEFFNSKVSKYLHDNDVYLFTTSTNYGAPIAERFIRTFRSLIQRYKEFNNTNSFIDTLPILVNSYNNSYNRNIKSTPFEADKLENTRQIAKNIAEIPYNTSKYRINSPKYKVGDYVRTAFPKTTFTKESTHEHWTREVFQITKVYKSTPTTYKLQDLQNTPVKQLYYEPQLQVVTKPTEYKVEKILQTRTVRGKKQYLVKWQGYPDKFNEWIDADKITVPKK